MSQPTAVHLALPCPYGGSCPGPVAGHGADICRPAKWKRTTDPAMVTCAKCLASPAFPVVKP